MGFTNNPKYFGRKPSENISSDTKKKKFGFKDFNFIKKTPNIYRDIID